MYPAEPDYIVDMYGEDSPERLEPLPQIVCWPGGWQRKGFDLFNCTTRDGISIAIYLRNIATMAKSVDQPSAALIADLEQRGMLDDTLVIWGGEFGRTSYSQGRLTEESFGRDHHPKCFSIWMAGGGIKPGITYGQTDDFGYNVVQDPVHVHDFQATLLYLLGIDHEKLTYKYQGRRFRLTDVHGKIVKGLLA